MTDDQIERVARAIQGCVDISWDDCLISAEAAIEAMQDWRPIDTLPLGRRVLMWWTPVNDNPLAEAAIIGEASIAGENYLADDWKPTKYWDGNDYKDLSRIKGWQPLPTLPKKD